MKVLPMIKYVVVEKGIIVDILLATAIFFLLRNTDFVSAELKRDDLKDITTSLIGTFISISGFSLAALTIILTIRSNVTGKENFEPQNALQALFNTPSYFQVVNIFKQIIITQALSALILYVTWLAFRLNSIVHFTFVLITLYALLASVLRLFYLLFLILGLEKVKKEKPYIAQKHYQD